MDMKGPMPSPLVVLCQDPGSVDISELSVSQAPWSWSNFTVKTLGTFFKGYCSLIDSVTMNETRFEDRFYPSVCFPSDRK